METGGFAQNRIDQEGNEEEEAMVAYFVGGIHIYLKARALEGLDGDPHRVATAVGMELSRGWENRGVEKGKETREN
ncbi:hypothetical protein GUJ93_ZPchr0010g11204 [Zizania palustris]|uniref:Uncharacterized protein n=1 Tax=Zizania palustris TaxID=103762 RepID=A0A8J5WI12_ZIZPA|nr:hypothetical protein GUJ93_ZPchr0010g11204 [Zizania palustris]